MVDPIVSNASAAMVAARQTGLNFPPAKWAALPDPSPYRGMAFYCMDTPEGPSLVVSDGAKWRIFARNIFRARMTLTAAMAGLATFTYDPIVFTSMPVVQVTLSDTAANAEGKLSYYVRQESMTGCSIRVERGTLLPTLLTALTGFNAFTGGSVAGVTVNITVTPTS